MSKHSRTTQSILIFACCGTLSCVHAQVFYAAVLRCPKEAEKICKTTQSTSQTIPTTKSPTKSNLCLLCRLYHVRSREQKSCLQHPWTYGTVCPPSHPLRGKHTTLIQHGAATHSAPYSTSRCLLWATPGKTDHRLTPRTQHGKRQERVRV